MTKVLLIDDDAVFCDVLTHTCQDLGLHCDCTGSDVLGQTLLYNQAYDILFLNARERENSADVMLRVKAAPSSPEVVLVSVPGSGVDAATAFELGAWDYLAKPVAIPYLRELLGRIVAYTQNKKDRHRSGAAISRERIIGQSPQLLSCLAAVSQAAHSSCSVFIHGETGTGKERIAHAIHDNSDRADGPFVVVDCTNLPETLAESLFFGHLKGSFTGAAANTDGFFRQAHGGTIFLDEVGDLSPELQKSLLRVLQERTFRPLGAKQEAQSDFRVVSASNRDLEALIRQDAFRSDLYYRLCTMQILLPPLRERVGDVARLVQYYLPRICEEYARPILEVSPDCLEILGAYEWPGNIRELMNTLYITVTESDGEPMIYPHHLPVNIRVAVARATAAAMSAPELPDLYQSGEPLPPLRFFREKYLEKAEKDYLELLRKDSNCSIMAACETAGITRARLYQLFKKYDFTFK